MKNIGIGIVIGISIFAGLASFLGYWEYQQGSGLEQQRSVLEQEKSELWTKIWYLEQEKSTLHGEVEGWKTAHKEKDLLIEGLIEEKNILYSDNSELQKELDNVKNDYILMQTQHDTVATALGAAETQQKQLEQQLTISKQPPYTVIQAREVIWTFKDSKGEVYNWNMPIDTYRKMITLQEPQDIIKLKYDDGYVSSVRDHTKFVDSISFAKVIDELYSNAGSDYQFVYEVWYIVSQMTTYSTDIQDDPRWALETFTEGGGDCEDTAILIASMLKSLERTKDWKIQMVFFDFHNPDKPKEMNHVALSVKTDAFKVYVESTAKQDGLNRWDSINGWYFDV